MELIVRKRFCLRAEINCVIFSVTNKFIIFNGIPNEMNCFIITMNVLSFLIARQINDLKIKQLSTCHTGLK